MANLKVVPGDWKKWKGETLMAFAFQEDAPHALGLGPEGSRLSLAAKRDGFKGRERETILMRPEDHGPAARIILIGLGKKEDCNSETLRRSVPAALRQAEQLGLASFALRAPELAKSPSAQRQEVQALAEGLLLAAYRFARYRSPSKEDPPAVEEAILLLNNVSADARQSLERGRIFSEATLRARDLINEPPSRMNPERLAAEALKLNQPPVSVRVMDKKELGKMGMEAILGVGTGGAVPPRLVEMIYKPTQKAKKIVALVGKGITFDSGGLSLKPPQAMETMKDDMSGAAAVLGVMSALSALKLPLEVRGYLAIAENMPGGRAQKPGDVLKAFNGKTIEVLNTDAEGRLVLADALSYASSKKPDLLIDIATLTGAAVVALGHLVTGVMGTDAKAVRAILEAGRDCGEKFWELPLVKEYRPDIQSKIADVKNIGGRRGEAGTIIGGLFLQEFVGQTPWVHLDIAGPSWSDSDQPYCPTGGTGHPVRTLLRVLEGI